MNLYTYDAQSRPTSAVVQPSAFSLQFAASTCNTTGNLTRISGRTRTCIYDAQPHLLSAAVSLAAVTATSARSFRCDTPSASRWPSRDPLEEQGGVNLYGFVGNDVVNNFDAFGLIESKGCCGPDVTAALNNTLHKIEAAYNGWGILKKASVCLALYSPSSAEGAWDIGYLAALGSNPERGCKSTVAFKGRCYHGGDVNYAMWGTVNRLCFRTFSKKVEYLIPTLGPLTPKPWSIQVALAAGAARKAYRFEGVGIVGSAAFTIYGYTGVLPKVAEASQCHIEKTNIYQEQSLKAHWDGNPIE